MSNQEKRYIDREIQYLETWKLDINCTSKKKRHLKSMSSQANIVKLYLFCRALRKKVLIEVRMDLFF